MPSLTDDQLSFTRFVQEQKRSADARAREGAAYAYGPELRTRQRLGRVRPVVLALDVGLADFEKRGRARLLEGSLEVGDGRFPTLAKPLREAAAALGVPVPRTYVSPGVGVHEACVFGTEDDPLVVLPAVFVDHLSAAELQCTLASALGRIHNGHAPWLTALWILQTEAPLALRWAATPASALLSAWVQGADITADRASLLVTRNLEASASALAKRLGGGRHLLADIRAEAALAHLDGGQPHPDVGLEPNEWHRWRMRVKAMELFRRTAFFTGGAGVASGPSSLTMAQCNDQVATLLGAI